MPANPSRARDGVLREQKQLDAIYLALSVNYPTFDQTDDQWTANGLSATPFHSLVSTSLSTMSLTKRVVRACVPLFQEVSTFEELAEIDDDKLRAIIKPVAHYNRKTKLLKAMSRKIIDQHDGVIPRTREELMQLPGVGQKVADIMLNFVFDEPRIAVDTHVLRLLRRLGVIRTGSADKAAEEINAKTSSRYKRHAHEWLIQHGMKICVSRSPRCGDCMITRHCNWFEKASIS